MRLDEKSVDERKMNQNRIGDERMKKTTKKINNAFAPLVCAIAFMIAGCSSTESASQQTGVEAPPVISEEQPESVELESAADTVQAQENGQKQSEETDSIMRMYSDMEQERMKELQESYQQETAKPEKMIQEVDSAEDVTEGMLCYITSTGEYYLPDRELTDEELLEIIDCNFRIALNANGWTQDKVDEANLKERAALEEKVKVANGISEEEAIEIAKKAMETDLGEKGMGLTLHKADESYGWRAYLWNLTDWDEYQDKGEIGYSIQFDNLEAINEHDDLFAYHCMVNAIDGSICGAYSSRGMGDIDDNVWYEH